MASPVAQHCDEHAGARSCPRVAPALPKRSRGGHGARVVARLAARPGLPVPASIPGVAARVDPLAVAPAPAHNRGHGCQGRSYPAPRSHRARRRRRALRARAIRCLRPPALARLCTTMCPAAARWESGHARQSRATRSGPCCARTCRAKLGGAGAGQWTPGWLFRGRARVRAPVKRGSRWARRPGGIDPHRAGRSVRAKAVPNLARRARHARAGRRPASAPGPATCNSHGTVRRARPGRTTHCAPWLLASLRCSPLSDALASGSTDGACSIEFGNA
jgi:hypothetical protein